MSTGPAPRRPAVVGIVGDGDASFFTGAQQIPRADFGVSVDLPLSVWLHVDSDLTVIHVPLSVATVPVSAQEAEHQFVSALLFVFLHANYIVWYAPSTRFDCSWLQLLQRAHLELVRLLKESTPTNPNTSNPLRQRVVNFQPPILSLVVNVPRSLLAPGQDTVRLLQFSVDQRMRQLLSAHRLTPPVSSRQVTAHPSLPNNLTPLSVYDSATPLDSAPTHSARGRGSQHRQSAPPPSHPVTPWLFLIAGADGPTSSASFVTVRVSSSYAVINANASPLLLAPVLLSPSSTQAQLSPLKHWADTLTSLPLAFSSLWLDLPNPTDASTIGAPLTGPPLSSISASVWARLPRDVMSHWQPAIPPSIRNPTTASQSATTNPSPSLTACHTWWTDSCRVLQACVAALQPPSTPAVKPALMSTPAAASSEANVSGLASAVPRSDLVPRCAAVTWTGWPCEAPLNPARGTQHRHRSMRSVDWVGCACGQSSVRMPDLWVDEAAHGGHPHGTHPWLM
jgi:hypothetical protein